jgi:hypothetical protein
MTDPAPLSCLSCGYDVSSIQTPRCPECGGALAEQDRASMARLRTLLDKGDSVPWRQIGAWTLVMLVYVVGAAYMNGELFTMIPATVLLTIAIAGSLALGNVAFLGLERHRRLAAIDAWRRGLWMLHLPWLVIAPLSVVMLAIAFALKAAGRYEEDTLVVGVVGLLVWLPCSIAAFFVFLTRARRRLDSLGANTREARVRLRLAALLVLSGAMFLGFGGGLLARYGASQIAGLTWQSDQW